MSAITERLALFDQAATYAQETIAELSESDLDRLTPCAPWDVRAVVLHLAEVADAVIDLTRTGHLSLPEPSGGPHPRPGRGGAGAHPRSPADADHHGRHR